jgi:sterol desaturase/sphingolipid hydroxylase (fatty acid hydroxylase superfamily)
MALFSVLPSGKERTGRFRIKGKRMREIFSHRAGRIFLLVLSLAVVGLLAATSFFSFPMTIFGWMSLPFVSGIVFIVIWLVAYSIYFFKYWPFR